MKQNRVWLNFVLLLLKFIRKVEFSTEMQRFQCFIKTHHCRCKIIIFGLSILTSNDNEIRITCFYMFFPFVDIFINDMIKTAILFVSHSLKNIKIRNEFIKRISTIKQKLIVILLQSSFFWYTRYLRYSIFDVFK